MISESVCRDCAPYTAHPNHWLERQLEILEWIATPLCCPTQWVRQHAPPVIHTIFGFGLGVGIDILRKIGVLGARKVTADDTVAAANLRIIAVAADRRGAHVECLTFRGKDCPIGELHSDHRRHYFEGLPLLTLATPKLAYDDKQALKQLLQRLDLPHAQGGAATSASRARRLAQQLGVPVVIKPRFGSLSRHTFVNLSTPIEIDNAIARTRQFSRYLIVEEFITGHVWRVVFVGDRLIAACRRDPPSIVGDGQASIRTLLCRKADSIESRSGRRIHAVSDSILDELTRKGYELDIALPTGQRVYLGEKVIAALGAEFHDATDAIHPDIEAQLTRLAHTCKAPLLGIDLIAPTLAEPLFPGKSVIIEVNSLPAIELHHYPSSGQSRDVAGLILDRALAMFHL